jgi:hypothetical protein
MTTGAAVVLVLVTALERFLGLGNPPPISFSWACGFGVGCLRMQRHVIRLLRARSWGRFRCILFRPSARQHFGKLDKTQLPLLLHAYRAFQEEDKQNCEFPSKADDACRKYQLYARPMHKRFVKRHAVQTREHFRSSAEQYFGGTLEIDSHSLLLHAYKRFQKNNCNASAQFMSKADQDGQRRGFKRGRQTRWRGKQ